MRVSSRNGIASTPIGSGPAQGRSFQFCSWRAVVAGGISKLICAPGWQNPAPVSRAMKNLSWPPTPQWGYFRVGYLCRCSQPVRSRVSGDGWRSHPVIAGGVARRVHLVCWPQAVVDSARAAGSARAADAAANWESDVAAYPCIRLGRPGDGLSLRVVPTVTSLAPILSQHDHDLRNSRAETSSRASPR
jgi:hypothetical protein